MRKANGPFSSAGVDNVATDSSCGIENLCGRACHGRDECLNQVHYMRKY